MKPDDTFLEVCAGWWTFSAMASAWGHNGAGIDIWEESLKFGERQLTAVPNGGRVVVINADARYLPMTSQTEDFIYCNPPFYQLEPYGGGEADLSTGDFDEWRSGSIAMMREWVRVLKPGRFAATVMADYRVDGLLRPLHAEWIKMGQDSGLEVWDIAVQHLTSPGMMLWGKSWLNMRTVKAHEYVIVFKAPGDAPSRSVTDRAALAE